MHIAIMRRHSIEKLVGCLSKQNLFVARLQIKRFYFVWFIASNNKSSIRLLNYWLVWCLNEIYWDVLLNLSIYYTMNELVKVMNIYWFWNNRLCYYVIMISWKRNTYQSILDDVIFHLQWLHLKCCFAAISAFICSYYTSTSITLSKRKKHKTLMWH